MNAHRTRGAIRPPRFVLGYRRSPGFTMIEILVTTAVTVVAFVGLVTVQVLALRAADSARYRSQATGLAYDMIDQLRLNRGADGTATSALGGGYDDATLCNSSARHAADSRNCQFDTLADLTGTQAVTLDLKGWWMAIDSAGLPNWYAMIQREGRLFRIAVQWDDERTEGNLVDPGETRASCLGHQMPASMQEVCVRTQL